MTGNHDNTQQNRNKLQICNVITLVKITFCLLWCFVEQNRQGKRLFIMWGWQWPLASSTDLWENHCWFQESFVMLWILSHSSHLLTFFLQMNNFVKLHLKYSYFDSNSNLHIYNWWILCPCTQHLFLFLYNIVTGLL